MPGDNIGVGIWQRYESAMARIRYLEKRVSVLRRYLDNTTDDMECLPECDSHGHEENCPVANPMAAFRVLRQRIRDLEAEIAEVHHTGGTSYIRLEKAQARIREIEASNEIHRKGYVSINKRILKVEAKRDSLQAVLVEVDEAMADKNYPYAEAIIAEAVHNRPGVSK